MSQKNIATRLNALKEVLAVLDKHEEVLDYDGNKFVLIEHIDLSEALIEEIALLENYIAEMIEGVSLALSHGTDKAILASMEILFKFIEGNTLSCSDETELKELYNYLNRCLREDPL